MGWRFEMIIDFHTHVLPPQVKEALYEEITPVNSFRVILNEYFDMDLDLLPDVSYYTKIESLEMIDYKQK